MYYIFVENGQINGAGQCLAVDDNVINYEVSESLYNDFISDSDKYTYHEDKIIENPDYEAIKRRKEIEKASSVIISQLEELDKKRIRAICKMKLKM